MCTAKSAKPYSGLRHDFTWIKTDTEPLRNAIAVPWRNRFPSSLFSSPLALRCVASTAPVSCQSSQKDTLAKATWLYHHQKLTQQQVADELGLSRPTVVRLLRQALEQGIVTVSLRLDVLRQMELSTRLAKRFELKEVFIVPTSVGHTEADILRTIIEMAALYLENNIQPNQVITTSWGKTLLEVARALNEIPLKGAMIAQSLGGLNSGHTFNLMEWRHCSVKNFMHPFTSYMSRCWSPPKNFGIFSRLIPESKQRLPSRDLPLCAWSVWGRPITAPLWCKPVFWMLLPWIR